MTIPTDVFEKPSGNFAQVLMWMDDFPLVEPDEAAWKLARQLPPTATLREVLHALGVSDTRIASR